MSRIINELKVVAIVQARMGSSRLPGKVMMDIQEGVPVIKYLCNRISLAKSIDQIIIATTNTEMDRDLAEYCRDNINCVVFKGSENDVYKRVLKAATSTTNCFESTLKTIVVDITGDCPFIDPKHIDELVYQVAYCNVDYASNIEERLFPDGFDVQVYTLKLMERVNKHLVAPNYRQHSGWNIPRLAYKLKPITTVMYNLIPKSKKYYLPEWALTLDTIEDLCLLRNITEHFGSRIDFSVYDVIDYVLENQHLLQINDKIQRREPGKLYD